MAKGQTIGLLNFGIGGDDAEIQKIFEKQKKQAKELQDLYKSIGFGNAKEQKAAYKSMMDQQRKNAVNVARIGEIQQRADDRSLLNQQRLLTEVQRTEAAKRRAANAGVQGQNQFNAALGMTNKTIFSQRNLLQQLSNAAGIYFSIYQAGSFVKELAMISGEFEKQRLSLAAIIQDQEASTKIFNQIKDLAVYSPFNFKELTDYAKQLSAFSIPANEIFDTMKRLADISAGLGVDMNRIILAYGQVRSASVLRGQELRQFTEAGIPLVDELAKKFGELENRVVSAGDVFDKISNRQVPFAMIKDIFEELTNEGGKFFEMQEIQAKSLSGMISNLRDAYDIMLDSIGQANSDLMKGAVGGLTDVMDNWERYWAILKGIIITFGMYKAVLIATSVAQKGLAVATMVQRFIELTKVVRASTATLAVLNMVGLANPITAVAALVAAISGLGYGIYKLTTSTTDLENAHKDLQTSFAQEELTLTVLTNRLKNATSGTKEYETAKSALNSKYGEHLKNLNLEAEALITSKDAYAELTKEIQKNASERLYSQYTESASTDAGKRIGDEYGKIIKQLKADVGEINYADVLSSVKSVLSNSSSSYQDVIAEFKKSGLDFEKYWRSVNAIYMEQRDLAKKVQDYQDIFSTTGTSGGKSTVKEEFSETVKAINSAIDSLNIGDEIKKKLKVTDVSKDFDTIRKDAIGAFEEIDKKLKDRKNASSLFSPEDMDKMQKERDAYLAFVNILGGIESNAVKSNMTALEGSLKYITDRLSEAKKTLEESNSEDDIVRSKSEIEFLEEQLNGLQSKVALMGKSVVLEAIQGVIQGVDVAVGKWDTTTAQEKIFGKLDTSDLKNIVNNINNPDTKRSVTEWKNLESAINKVGREINEVGDSIGGTSGELLKFAGGVATSTLSMMNNITRLSELSSKSIEKGATLAARAVNAVEKASVILAIISAALKVVSMITNALDSLKDAEREREEALKSLIDLQQSYNNELIRSKLLQNDVFGTNDIGNMISATNALSEATENYNNILDLQQKKWKDPDSKFYDKLYQYGTIMGWAGDRTVNDKTGTTALRNNLRYITKKSSNGVLGIGGNHTKTMDLEEWVKKNLGKELFFKDGRLNLELALQLVDSSADRLAGETEESLRKLIEAEEIIREAEEAMAEYISNTFGQLGDGMSDSIIRAFRNGENAAKSFKDSVNSVLEEIGAQIVRNLYIQNQLDALEKNLKPIYEDYAKSGDKEVFTESLMSQLESFWKGMGASVDQANNFLDMYQQSAQKHGFDIYKPDSNKGTLGASIQSLTENTGSLVASYMNAMRADLAQQNAMVERIGLMIGNNSIWFAQVYAKLVEIEINTKLTASNTTELVNISKEMRSVLKSATIPGSAVKFNVK